MAKAFDFLKSLRIAGIREFWLEAIIIIPIGCLLPLSFHSFSGRLPFVIEGVIVFFCMDFWACLWNCVADYELDKISRTKKHLALATERLGLETAKILAITLGVLGFSLGVHLSVVLSAPVLSVILGLGMFLGYAYSVEPFRTKRRKALRFVTLSLLFRVLPLLFAFFITAKEITRPFAMFLLVYIPAGIFVSGSLNIVYNLADLWEEERLDVKTMELVYGVEKSLKISKILIILGSVICLIAYIYAGFLKFISLTYWIIVLALFAVSYLPITIVIMKRNTAIMSIKSDERREMLAKYSKIYPLSLKILRSVDLLILLTLSLG